VKVEPAVTAPFVLTVTVAVPADAMRFAATAHVSDVALPKVVGSAAPFHIMVEFDAKPEPLTVRLNAAPPACADDGFRLLIIETPAPIVKVELLLVMLLVFTVTAAVPWVAMKLAATAAVN